MKTEKPRLVKMSGFWYCMAMGSRAGLGFTAKDAYDEWVARNGR